MEASPRELTERALRYIEGKDLTKLPKGGFEGGILHPNMEFDVSAMQLPDVSGWRGADAVLRGWRRWLEQWEDYRITGSGLEAHGDSVLLDIHAEIRGRGSGVPITADQVQVWTWRGQKLFGIQVFPSRAAAMASLNRSPAG